MGLFSDSNAEKRGAQARREKRDAEALTNRIRKANMHKRETEKRERNEKARRNKGGGSWW